MCGIAGAIWASWGTPVERPVLAGMTGALRHRGPDDEGAALLRNHAAGGVALGHRRLSIIDLEGGHQPLCNEDGTVWVTFNGEVYNFPELADMLSTRGHRLRTRCDTEIIVHLYEEYGEECIGYLRGMFAFAIWDAAKHQLLLARDRLGQKPLVYRQEPGRLLFASQLKALLQVPDVPRDIDPEALDQYVRFHWIPHPRTIYRGMAKLPPAHYAVWRDDRLRIARYWAPDCTENADLSVEEYGEQLRETLTEATRMRLVSDVPLGAFLSGGIDSTIVAGLAQQLTDAPLTTFTIGFPVKHFDETSFARLAAAHLGVEHHESEVVPDSVEVLPKLVYHYDEPFADASAIPTYYLSQVARRHVTVALTGDAGDELFLGYGWHRNLRVLEWLDRLPQSIRRLALSRISRPIRSGHTQRSLLRRAKNLLELMAEEPRRRYQRLTTCVDVAHRAELYADDFATTLSGYDPAEFLLDSFCRSQGRDLVTRAGLADLAGYLPADILVKVDVASMAHGLECRSPFLDHHVVELAARMPVRLKMPRFRGKWILRHVFRDLLPGRIVRRPKMGFAVPLGNWLRGPLRQQLDETLLDPSSLERGYFRASTLRQWIDEHASGIWDHSARLWSLLILEHWHREFVDGAARAETEASESECGCLRG